MSNKEHLKTMIQDLIQDRPEQAEVALHSYLVDRMQEVAGFKTPAAPVEAQEASAPVDAE